MFFFRMPSGTLLVEPWKPLLVKNDGSNFQAIEANGYLSKKPTRI